MSSRRGPRPVVLLAAGVAAAGLTLMALSTLLTVAFTDYEAEALPSITALLRGDLGTFLGLLPAYGGSLILRAPAALGAHALGAGELGVYRALAAPCLIAAAALAVHLFCRLAPRGAPVGLAPWLALGAIALNPLVLPALDAGHPEELLGAVLCAAAVLAALADRPALAGVLLGCAGANKAWAVLAVVPALLALRQGRTTMLLWAGGVCGLLLAPALLHGTQGVASAQSAAHGSGVIFQPWQLGWFLGHHGAAVHGLYGVKVGYRTAPGWVGSLGHLPVLVVPLAVAALAVARRVGRSEVLLLLALCFLLRCVLDPWDTAYYHLPFVVALAAHEVVGRRRAPVAALVASAVIYGVTVIARDHLTADTQAALYLLWSVPAMAALGTAVFLPERWRTVGDRAAAATARVLPSLSRALAPAGVSR